jgi:hypothetical protein
MNKRPISITIISWVFIVFGIVALFTGLLPRVNITAAQRVAEFKGHWFVHLSRLLMIVIGVFMLYGRNWARWLMVPWLAFHVVVGFLHSPVQLLTHLLLAVVIVYFLFRPPASVYFRSTITAEQ